MAENDLIVLCNPEFCGVGLDIRGVYGIHTVVNIQAEIQAELAGDHEGHLNRRRRSEQMQVFIDGRTISFLRSAAVMIESSYLHSTEAQVLQL